MFGWTGHALAFTFAAAQEVQLQLVSLRWRQPCSDDRCAKGYVAEVSGGSRFECEELSHQWIDGMRWSRLPPQVSIAGLAGMPLVTGLVLQAY